MAFSLIKPEEQSVIPEEMFAELQKLSETEENIQPTKVLSNKEPITEIKRTERTIGISHMSDGTLVYHIAAKDLNFVDDFLNGLALKLQQDQKLVHDFIYGGKNDNSSSSTS